MITWSGPRRPARRERRHWLRISQGEGSRWLWISGCWVPGFAFLGGWISLNACFWAICVEWIERSEPYHQCVVGLAALDPPDQFSPIIVGGSAALRAVFERVPVGFGFLRASAHVGFAFPDVGSLGSPFRRSPGGREVRTPTVCSEDFDSSHYSESSSARLGLHWKFAVLVGAPVGFARDGRYRTLEPLGDRRRTTSGKDQDGTTTFRPVRGSRSRRCSRRCTGGSGCTGSSGRSP